MRYRPNFLAVMTKNNIFASDPQGVDGITAVEFIAKYAPDFDFDAYTELLRPQEVKDFITFFECVRLGLIMADRNNDGVDRSGKYYKFYNFIRARATTGVKIFPFGDWEQFIRAYQDGEVRIAFTAEELIEAAMNK